MSSPPFAACCLAHAPAPEPAQLWKSRLERQGAEEVDAWVATMTEVAVVAAAAAAAAAAAVAIPRCKAQGMGAVGGGSTLSA
eukprot:778776-Pelagomonas_calceolata.AAC.3